MAGARGSSVDGYRYRRRRSHLPRSSPLLTDSRTYRGQPRSVSGRDIEMRYRIALLQSEEGFSVSVPGLPGCWSQGSTEEEAIENSKTPFASISQWSKNSFAVRM